MSIDHSVVMLRPDRDPLFTHVKAGMTVIIEDNGDWWMACLLYTSPSPRDYAASRMPSSA